MIDRNNKPVTVGARCLFKTDGRRGWVPGTVRALSEHREAARVDDGDPANADLLANGFHVSAWVEAKDIDVVESAVRGRG